MKDYEKIFETTRSGTARVYIRSEAGQIIANVNVGGLMGQLMRDKPFSTFYGAWQGAINAIKDELYKVAEEIKQEADLIERHLPLSLESCATCGKSEECVCGDEADDE